MTRSFLIGLALTFCIAQPSANAMPPWREPVPLQADVLFFDKWTVGCSNLDSCMAIAPMENHNDADERAVYIQMIFTREKPDPQMIGIYREDKWAEALSPLASHQMTEALLGRTRTAPEYSIADGARYSVPKAGFGDVMAELAQWRAAPPSAVTSTDVVTLLPAVRLENPVLPFKVVGGGKRCPKASMGQSLQAWRGIGGQILWRVGCGMEGLNSASFWYVADIQGAPAVEIRFADRYGPVILYNSWFDPSSGLLHSVHYFQGEREGSGEDCGIYRDYAWSFGGMKLVEQRSMPICGRGIGPAGWIPVYRATMLSGKVGTKP